AGQGRRTPILLRAAVGPATRLERVRLVGDDGAGKFGMDGESLVDGAVRAGRSSHLDLLGLHAFGASNVLDADALAEHIEHTVSAARSIARPPAPRPWSSWTGASTTSCGPRSSARSTGSRY